MPSADKAADVGTDRSLPTTRHSTEKIVSTIAGRCLKVETGARGLLQQRQPVPIQMQAQIVQPPLLPAPRQGPIPRHAIDD
jgi:hypothetical protein